MKRLMNPRREWARLGIRAGLAAGFFLVLFALFGVHRVEGDVLAPDVKDGDLLIYMRFLSAEVGELAVDGGLRRIEEAGDSHGKVLWSIRVRDI